MRFPTLSELIEACGTEVYFVVMRDNGVWKAGTGKNTSSGEAKEGSTPEEAVANLWLALHAEKEA